MNPIYAMTFITTLVVGTIFASIGLGLLMISYILIYPSGSLISEPFIKTGLLMAVISTSLMIGMAIQLYFEEFKN